MLYEPLECAGELWEERHSTSWFCGYWLTNHHLTDPIMRKDDQIQLMWFGQSSQWEGKQNGLVDGTYAT